MITTLSGSNHFLLKSELDRLVQAFVAEHTDMGLEQFDGEEAEYDRMREALESLPFLASKKMVVLKKPSANKQFVEHFESLLVEMPVTTDVVIVEPKLDKRLSYYKYLKSKTEFKDFSELDEQAMGRWLVERAKAQQGTLSTNDARYLIERVGLNQQQLSNEIDKLLNYRPQITRDTIDLLTDKAPQSTIFELIDAAMSGQVKRAMQLYDEQRRQKVEPQQILAMIVWQLHVLAVVKTAGQRDANEIAKQAKLSPYVVRKSQGIARRISLQELKDLIRSVLKLDISLKSKSIDADDALQNLFITIANLQD